MNFFVTNSAPPPPTNLRYTEHFFNSPEFVAISWDLPQINNLEKFIVSIKNLKTENTETFETNGNQIIYEVEDTTTYHVTVTTVNKSGQESIPSELLEMKIDFGLGGIGIAIPSKTIFNIYPNPANSILNITSEIAEPATIEIYNLNGSKILKQRMTEPHHSINISDFTAGVYFIKIDNSVKKFIKY
jgi:hypothetical protein